MPIQRFASDLVPAFQFVSRLAEGTAEAHVQPLLATPQVQEPNTEAKFGPTLFAAPFFHPSTSNGLAAAQHPVRPSIPIREQIDPKKQGQDDNGGEHSQQRSPSCQ